MEALVRVAKAKFIASTWAHHGRGVGTHYLLRFTVHLATAIRWRHVVHLGGGAYAAGTTRVAARGGGSVGTAL